MDLIRKHARRITHCWEQEQIDPNYEAPCTQCKYFAICTGYFEDIFKDLEEDLSPRGLLLKEIKHHEISA